MQTKRLALRVTLNSIGMIFLVYLVMQVFSYFRDNIILGVSDLAALPGTIALFMGANVIPPMAVLGSILFLAALPIQRAQERLEAGEILSPAELEATRKRMLGFSNVVLAMNLLGFAAGYILLQVFMGQVSLLLRFDRLVILLSNLAGAAIYASAQSALDGMAFAPLRESLGIHEIGKRRRETSSAARQAWFTILAVAYVLTFIQFNLRDLSTYNQVELGIAASVRRGELEPESAGEACRAALAEALPSFTSRKALDVASIPLPWERGIDASEAQQRVFLLYFVFLATIVSGLQLAISRERRGETAALKARLREAVEGEGDLRARLALRSMDDFGELAELINRLLDQFSRVVGGIAERFAMAPAWGRCGALRFARAPAWGRCGA